MKAKPFSCIALQHRGAKKIYEETKNLTIAEELVYWQQHTSKLQQHSSKKITEPSQRNMS
ncbi:MAG: hypothetical protein DRR08_17670 [Candidatus Parabeggiatoa sp. nov. 2]|nr:MAG: hypothetical protein B6247_11035 [Beggiatoa sp. 4572_84]RKZ57948.1 MAG: hypothetical protein DRR08_17670 [Gammaproteobacteria bacterium]